MAFTCSMQKKKESFAKKSGYRPSYYDHSLIMAITYKGSTIYCGAEDGDMWSNDIEDAYVWNSFDTISTIAVENFVDVAKEALETRWISEDNVEYLPAPIDTYESKKSEGATGIGDTMYASKLKSLARKLGSFGFKVSDTVEVKDENANDKSAEYNLSAKKDGKSYKINVDIYEGKHTTITLRDGATNAYISHLGEGSSFASAVSAIDADSVKSESKKSEGVYGTIRVDSEDIAIKVQESNVYPSSSGRSLSVEVPNVEAWFSTLSEFSDCIDGMAEDCNGYPDISRDGSDILVQINAPKEDESDDYEVIVELRCSTEITSTSLEGVVDLLNHD